MPIPWVPNELLLADVGRFIGLDDTAELATRWGGICARANSLAQAELSGILAAKGYSAAQIATWDFRREYVLEYGTYLAIKRGAPEKEQEAKPLDRTQELREAAVIIAGGVPVGPTSPASTDVGGIGYGTRTSAREDLEREARCKGWFS